MGSSLQKALLLSSSRKTRMLPSRGGVLAPRLGSSKSSLLRWALMRPPKARIAAGLLARPPFAALRAAVVAAALPPSRLLG
eukprot:15279210-Alexandrium_andersonii.AAC.1